MIASVRGLKRLKGENRPDDDFNTLKAKLEKAGIFNKLDQKGTCIYYNSKRGFGFLTVNGNKHFIHITAIKGGGEPVKGEVFKVTVADDGRVETACRVNS